MDYAVSWSPAALEDVDAIAEYISRDSPAYARAVVNKLLTAAANLSRFPARGRVVPELDDANIRECFVYSYRLIYRIQDHMVLVAAVIHGRCLLEPFVEQITDA